MIFPSVHYAFAEFGGGAVRPPSKYAPAHVFFFCCEYEHSLTRLMHLNCTYHYLFTIHQVAPLDSRGVDFFALLPVGTTEYRQLTRL